MGLELRLDNRLSRIGDTLDDVGRNLHIMRQEVADKQDVGLALNVIGELHPADNTLINKYREMINANRIEAGSLQGLRSTRDLSAVVTGLSYLQSKVDRVEARVDRVVVAMERRIGLGQPPLGKGIELAQARKGLGRYRLALVTSAPIELRNGKWGRAVAVLRSENAGICSFVGEYPEDTTAPADIVRAAIERSEAKNLSLADVARLTNGLEVPEYIDATASFVIWEDDPTGVLDHFGEQLAHLKAPYTVKNVELDEPLTPSVLYLQKYFPLVKPSQPQ